MKAEVKASEATKPHLSEVIECADGQRGQKYVQSWENNMGVRVRVCVCSTCWSPAFLEEKEENQRNLVFWPEYLGIDRRNW